MNKKIPNTHSNTEMSRQDHAPAGKDLPLITQLVNHINTLDSSRHIRFSVACTQCSSLDLHLVTDKLNRQVIKVIDSARKDGKHGKDVIREIPHTDLQHIMLVNPAALNLRAKGCKRATGTEVALPMCSALEVL